MKCINCKHISNIRQDTLLPSSTSGKIYLTGYCNLHKREITDYFLHNVSCSQFIKIKECKEEVEDD